MHVYCVRELHMSDDMAYKRIRVARAARRYPALLPVIADGRLHLTAIVLLAPLMTPSNVNELIEAATHRKKSDVELLVASLAPRPDVPESVRELKAPIAQLVPEPVVPTNVTEPLKPMVPVIAALAATPAQSAAVQVPFLQPAAHPKLAPIAPSRFELRVTVDQETYEQLQRAKELLGHTVPSGELASVLKYALDACVKQLEKQRFAKAAHERPRRGRAQGRHIPASIKREVWKRDNGRCTFVGSNGKHCHERVRLEYDHIIPVARGGETCAENLRLRCRAHNALEAERAFGESFMRAKRESAHSRSSTQSQ
jgi:5-methylcytosine-specific restriction endonuclease McrA